MKKLIVHLSAFSTVGLTAATVVSCIPAKFADGPIGQRVVIVTDGGNIRDRSFNESSWESVIDYGAQIHTNIYTDETRTQLKTFTDTPEGKAEAFKFDYASSWAGREFRLENPQIDTIGKYGKDGKVETFEASEKASSNYVETAGHDLTNFYAGYKMGLYKKADAILLAGFGHLGSVGKLIKWMEKDEKTLVLLDAQVDYKYEKDADGNIKLGANGRPIPTQNKNVISVQYDSELSGFNAAWDTALWANMPEIDMTTGKWTEGNKLNGDANGDGEISMGTFGGISSKFSVDNSMWGYLLAIELFNQTIAGQEFELKDSDDKVKNFKPKKIKFGNAGNAKEGDAREGTIDKVKAINNSDGNWFSNSFGYGDANRNGIIPYLTGNGTDIIMGVAGPQTNDIAETDASYKPFIVGIDTDQIKSVGSDKNAQDRFITSSTKGLAQAAIDSFKKSKSLKYIYEDETKTKISHYVNGKETDDGYLAVQKPTWTVSSSRNPNVKWKTGENKAINAVDYNKGFAKELFTKIPAFYKSLGEKPQYYIQGSELKKAAELIIQTAKGLDPKDWKIDVNGIDGYNNYLVRLLQSFKETTKGDK
ncbi:ribose/galactose ABC transporter substrate-binding protein [Williamsoniiplasma luminosum]|uniref:Ribose/galactose ABC transporter substrate-binding protein n=1 Tax=Williamsoniiplasma luminosum TaxID=214888 RepID=A0A2K8NTZ9_9MOLU|nr:hypothetical protein [Williamsoniiplasma luminosum]ATZ17269.1 ribose/galactose ABC transporter substrate-binding protein [Williamsoniiplasma luminosum]